MKKNPSKPVIICALICIVLSIPFFMSCQFNDDDDTTVTVCNLDDHKYDVELRKNSDDSVVDEMRVEEWYTLGDRCDTSKNVDEGRYYLVVFDDDGITDESDDFYLDEGESREFEIDGDGDLIHNFYYNDQAIVSVCNSNADEYRVALKRSSDDSLVNALDVLECHDFKSLAQGRYYIEIYEVGDNDIASRSDDFYLGLDEDKYFSITHQGDLAIE